MSQNAKRSDTGMGSAEAVTCMGILVSQKHQQSGEGAISISRLQHDTAEAFA